MALTPTQYYLLHQWAAGKCVTRRQVPQAGQDWTWASPLDIATAGNAVGEPMAPGIEVTWTMRNPIILTPGDPFRVQPQDENYHTSGLCPSRDETLTGGGCQPGDLTKRMAIPWQADFFDCSVQAVNFTTPRTNKIISNVTASRSRPLSLPIGGRHRVPTTSMTEPPPPRTRRSMVARYSARMCSITEV